MESLPVEILLAIFSNLNASECFKSRRVCRKWLRLAARGCMSLTVVCGGALRNNRYDIGGISLIGSLQSEGTSEEASKPRKRTRGHLPEPAVLLEGRPVASLSVQSLFSKDTRGRSQYVRAIFR